MSFDLLCFPRSGGLPTHTKCDCARRAPGKTSEDQSTRHGGANTNRASGLLRSLAAGAKSGVLAVTVSVAGRSPCVQRPWWPPEIVRGVGCRRGIAGAGAKLVPMRSHAAAVGRRVASMGRFTQPAPEEVVAEVGIRGGYRGTAAGRRSAGRR